MPTTHAHWRGRGFEGISMLGKSGKSGNKLKEEHLVQVVKMPSKEWKRGIRQAGRQGLPSHSHRQSAFP